jgi:outer membrane receptor protein involved in Fe transport
MRDAGAGAGDANCGVTAHYAELYVPGMAECPDGGIPFYLRQDRGEFGLLNFKTTSRGHTVFAQDNWSPNKYVTINAGLRWEQQQVEGGNVAYTATTGRRVSASAWIMGKSETKIGQLRTLRICRWILSLAQRGGDFSVTNWQPNTLGQALVNPDGT